MPTPRDTAIAAATAFIDALIAAAQPAPAPAPAPTTTVSPTTGHPRIMLGSQAARLKAALTSVPGQRWRAACDRWLAGESLWGFAAWNGALAYQLTGDSRYAAKAVATIEAQVVSAEAKIAAGLAPEVAGDSYLQVGEMIGDLALVYDWCSGIVTAGQRTRWLAYADRAVNNVWTPGAASWGGKTMTWSGWAIDDPGNNYFYSFLRATMLLGLATQGEDAMSPTWLGKFRERLVGRLVPYMTASQPDGGSREGTGYGVALRNLWELYALWQWSTGERIADLTPHTRASLATAAAQIVPTLDRIAPIGDQSRDSTAAFFDYHRDYLLKILALYPTAVEAPSVAALLAQSSVPSMQNSFMLAADMIYLPTVAPALAITLPTARYAAGIGELCARTGWDKGATWLNLIAGPLTQSHAHQDQGSLMLYDMGWLIADAVLWSRSGVRDPASPVGTTAAHSLVRIDVGGVPVPQRDSPTAGKVLALHSGPGYLFVAADLTGAYGGSAAVQLVRRQVLWLQPNVVIVHDHVITGPDTTQTWQLVVPTRPAIDGAVATVVSGSHTMRVTRATPAGSAWSVAELPALSADFTGGYRLDNVWGGGDQERVTTIALDGAVVPTNVAFADVGCTFMVGATTVTLGAGIDPL